MQLSYDSPTGGGTAQYNGNISTMQWGTYINSTCLPQQQYRLSYDAADRITAGDHWTNSGSWVNTNNYSESNITYDLNGNIRTYTRRGLTVAPSTFGIIDQLTYSYGDAVRPDLLTDVQDAGSLTKGFVDNASSGTNYLYDADGNLTQDVHKTMVFTYNHLNLPNSLVKDGISTVTWTYTANGEKLTKVGPGGTRNYVSGIEYLGANTEAIYHAEGRCTPNGSSWFYEYTLKDHLGDARVNFRANGTAVTYLEDFHYYPFGMAMEGLGTILSTGNDYRYNGKELNEDYSLNWYDYGKRWYDPSLGRFVGVDPIAEKYNYVSVYNYAENEPIANIDLWGLQKYRFDGSNEIDKKGIIRDVSDDQAVSSVEGAIVRVTFQVLDLLGINRLDNAVSDLISEKEINITGVIEAFDAVNSIIIPGTPGSQKGRGGNKRMPDPEATGDHTVINEKGATTFELNSKNPSGFQEKERIDLVGPPHYNKSSKELIPTPHKQSKEIPGGVKPLNQNEIPKYKGPVKQDKTKP